MWSTAPGTHSSKAAFDVTTATEVHPDERQYKSSTRASREYGFSVVPEGLDVLTANFVPFLMRNHKSHRSYVIGLLEGPLGFFVPCDMDSTIPSDLQPKYHQRTAFSIRNEPTVYLLLDTDHRTKRRKDHYPHRALRREPGTHRLTPRALTSHVIGIRQRSRERRVVV